MATEFAFNFTTTDQGAADVTCPPKDIYELRVTKIGEMYQRESEKFQTIDTQNRIEFEVDDPGSEHHGAMVSDFFVWGRQYKDSGKVTQTWAATGERGKRSKANELLEALMGQPWKPGMTFDPTLQEFVGTHIRAMVEPNDKGYPKLSAFMPSRRQRGTAPAAPAPATVPPAAPVSSDDPATEMQLKRISRLWDSLGIGDADGLKDEAITRLGVTPEQMTRAEAAGFIEYLTTLDPEF